MPKSDVLRRIDHRDPKVAVAVPEPGWRIKEEIEWGQEAAVGRSLRYAREDHTHGTPEKPYELQGSAAGGHHVVRVSVPLPATVLPPGPYNLSLGSDGVTGVAMTYKAIRIEADGEVAGAVAGQAFSFAAGGGVVGPSALAGTWAYGDAIAYSIDSQGIDGTYLVADIVAWESA